MLQMNNASNKVNVSVIGYKGQELKIETGKIIIIELESSDVAISEVTVTAQSKATGGLTNIEDRDKASSSVKIDLMDMSSTNITSRSLLIYCPLFIIYFKKIQII